MRKARSGSTGVRLAALGAARRPAQAAAVTTFLAVALGAALFSLDYRATLDRNARESAQPRRFDVEREQRRHRRLKRVAKRNRQLAGSNRATAASREQDAVVVRE